MEAFDGCFRITQDIRYEERGQRNDLSTLRQSYCNHDTGGDDAGRLQVETGCCTGRRKKTGSRYGTGTAGRFDGQERERHDDDRAAAGSGTDSPGGDDDGNTSGWSCAECAGDRAGCSGAACGGRAGRFYGPTGCTGAGRCVGSADAGTRTRLSTDCEAGRCKYPGRNQPDDSHQSAHQREEQPRGRSV